MKFTKSNANNTAKLKAPLSGKNKFKNKNVAVTNVKLPKDSKVVAELLKNTSGDDSKKNVKVVKGLKDKKKSSVKPSPEVQLGLKLDKLLEKKVKKKQGNSFEETPVKSSPDKSVSGEASQSNSSSKKKRNRGRKKQKSLNGSQTNSLSTDELLTESSNSDVAPGKRRKLASKKKDIVKKDGVVSSESSHEEDTKESEYSLVPKDVLNAVKSMLDVFMKKNTKKLLDSEPEPIFLKFLFYLPHNKSKIIRFNLPHSLVWDTSDICLFVSDLVKKDAEESKSKWEEILRNENVSNITEVIPLKSLLSDYRQFQDKRKLSDRFDYFLVDGKITHRVVGLLGNKYFNSKRKTPFPVQLEKGKMKEAIAKALSRTVSQYTPTAETFSIQVGHTGMSAKEVQDNILKVWDHYPEQFCVYWQNVHRASLSMSLMKDMPIFCNLVPPKEGNPKAYKNMKWQKDSNVPVMGELSTQMDKKVLVYPSGKVLVKQAPKPKITEETILAKRLKRKENRKLNKLKRRQSQSDGTGKEDSEVLESDDDLGGRKDMLESDTEEELEFEESSSEEEEDKPALKQKAQGKKEVLKAAKETKRKGKKKADVNTNDSDSDGVVDKAEEMYLNDLALEKEKTVKAASKKQKAKVLPEKADDSAENDDEDQSTDEEGWFNEESMEENGSDEDIPTLVPAKSNKSGKKKSGQKINGESIAPSLRKKKKPQNKPASQKKKEQVQSKKNPKRIVAEEQSVSTKKKSSEPSFQGVKADQKKSKTKKPNPTNKLMKKKLSK